MPALTLFSSLPLAAQSSGDPGAFYGFWETQEPAGDTCVINVKRGNRISSFYTGSASSRIVKGTWELQDDRLVATWESGHKDVLVRLGDGAVQREAYNPGKSVGEQPDYTSRAIRIDPRVPGSLGVQSEGSDWQAREQSEGPGESRERRTDVPIRNDFNGYWKVRQGSGGFLGIGASGAEEFYVFLQRNGTAQASLRRWDLSNSSTGRWTVEGDTAVISWPNGQTDVLRESSNSGYALAFYDAGFDKGKKPEAVMPAVRSSPNEAAQYFNAGDVRLFTMTDIRGVWIPQAGAKAPDRWVHVESWGRASRYPIPADSTGRGEWKLFNDRVVITWDDGSKDVIRSNVRGGWFQDSFPPGVPASGTPSDTILVRRVEASEVNLGSRR